MANASSDYALAVRFWLNGDAGRPWPADAPKDLTVTRKIGFHLGTQGTGVVDWALAPVGEVESFAVKLARSDSDLIAVRDLALIARPVMAVRGRTVARA